MLFGSSGIRRLYNESLVRLALEVGAVVATRADTVVVGRDTRTTGHVLSHSFMAGVLSAGSSVLYGGIAPTPTVAYCARNADAGCSITASHNPEPYNGLKLFNPDGASFTRTQQQNIEKSLSSSHWKGWECQGESHSVDLITPHKNEILKRIHLSRDLSMVVECGNGAGSVITPQMLSEAGVNITCVNCNTWGRFSRPSEPLESNVPYVSDMVKTRAADGAIIHDGDADRMMAFDGKGRYIKGDHLLMLFARYLDAHKVVTTVDASMAIEEIADVQRTAVGDSFVSERLMEWGDFGGEASGSWIFPRHSLCPDGIFAAALFCEIASEWNIADVIDEMPDYPLIRESIPCEDPEALLMSLGADVATDGIRFENEDGWCLIRASGTEPKVRITAEGRSREIARDIAEKGLRMIQKAKAD